jgi:hypothetical protein
VTIYGLIQAAVSKRESTSGHHPAMALPYFLGCPQSQDPAWNNSLPQVAALDLAAQRPQIGLF